MRLGLKLEGAVSGYLVTYRLKNGSEGFSITRGLKVNFMFIKKLVWQVKS
ncbi:MAG: hypothetical protein LBF54_02640 [Holosporaceae bacterium]|nr:hypothetical protein [Holosporaceae bacterium]